MVFRGVVPALAVGSVVGVGIEDEADGCAEGSGGSGCAALQAPSIIKARLNIETLRIFRCVIWSYPVSFRGSILPVQPFRSQEALKNPSKRDPD